MNLGILSVATVLIIFNYSAFAQTGFRGNPVKSIVRPARIDDVLIQPGERNYHLPIHSMVMWKDIPNQQ
jgi:hypothetical protein